MLLAKAADFFELLLEFYYLFFEFTFSFIPKLLGLTLLI